jgi:acyl carrier protein
VATPEQVKSFVEERLNERLPELAGKSLDPRASLVATGIVDSFSFLELVAEVEAKFGTAIDLGQYDFEEVSSLEGLCRAVIGK